MLQHLFNCGKLDSARNVFGSTSGNTGKAAAAICAELGLQYHAVVDRRIPRAKVDALEKSGAYVVRVEGNVLDRIRITRELVAATPQAVDLDQYGNPGAAVGHYSITAPWIWRELRGFDVLVAALGTGGTFAGLTAALTAEKPDLIAVAVDCKGSALIAGHVAPRLLRGIGCAFVPQNVRMAYPLIRGAKAEVVGDREAFLAARCLLEHEGVGVGGSGGAVLHAAFALHLGCGTNASWWFFTTAQKTTATPFFPTAG